MWCVPELTVEYVARMENILRLYARPYNPRYPVVGLDERPVVLRGDSRPGVRLRPGRVARRDYEYVRRGTANLFVALEPKTGRYPLRSTRKRNALEFARMLRQLDRAYPQAKRLHLVLDNLSTHTRRSLEQAFGAQEGRRLWERFIVHYTPKHASWLNVAEIGISVVSRLALGRDRIPNLHTLTQRARAFVRHKNRRPQPVHWRFTVENARTTFKYIHAIKRE